MIDQVRQHSDDFDELIREAGKALKQALRDGERKGYQPGDWQKRDSKHHLNHAARHVLALTQKDSIKMRDEQLAYAVCRLLMAWTTREEG